MPRKNTRHGWLPAVGLLCALWLGACAGSEPCDVPGVVTQCACGAGMGARICGDDRTWQACDCSGTIALPVEVMASTPNAGTGASGSGGGTAGTGTSMRRDSGVSLRDSGDSDGSAADGGMVDANVAPPSAAYRACMTDAECDPGSKCIVTAGAPTASVCAPACVNTVDCPVPEGTYEAKVNCVTGYCQLDCTPVLFAPLLTCPGGMTCVIAALGSALCHDDGM
jgi:hypothetical protein